MLDICARLVWASSAGAFAAQLQARRLPSLDTTQDVQVIPHWQRAGLKVVRAHLSGRHASKIRFVSYRLDMGLPIYICEMLQLCDQKHEPRASMAG